MTQIITNYDFTDGTTGWTNSGGAFSGNNQPAVTSNVLRFTYQERTVSQEAAILPRVGMGPPFVFPMTARGRSFGSWVTR